MLYSEIDISSIENKLLSTIENVDASSKFFDEIKNKCKISPIVLLKMFDSFLKTKISEIKFLLLEAMRDVISGVYRTMDPQIKIELRKMIYQSILNRDFMLSLTKEKFLMIKFSNSMTIQKTCKMFLMT